MIQGIKVISSNVDTISYQGSNLYVRFKHGGAYIYADVPVEFWHELCTAESAGQFINQIIKPRFAARKLEFDPFTQENQAA